MQEAIESINDPSVFCRALFQSASNEPSKEALKLIYQILQIKTSLKLREEALEYFGLPIFTKLSEIRLKQEIESCQDSRLEEAVSNISSSLNDEKNFILNVKSKYFNNFIENILNSSNLEYIEVSVELIILLLLQPSCRRFVKPLLEDKLFLSFIKLKLANYNLISELEDAFFFPIDEISGVYYESQEEFISAHFSKIRNFQTKLFEFDELSLISKHPLNSFNNFQNICNSLNQLSDKHLEKLLFIIGCAGFAKDTPRHVLIDAIASNLFLRNPSTETIFSVYPTEVIQAMLLIY